MARVPELGCISVNFPTNLVAGASNQNSLRDTLVPPFQVVPAEGHSLLPHDALFLDQSDGKGSHDKVMALDGPHGP